MNNDNNLNCSCIGYAYVPVQELEKIFDAENALKCASLFPELVLNINEYGNICKQLGGVD